MIYKKNALKVGVHLNKLKCRLLSKARNTTEIDRPSQSIEFTILVHSCIVSIENQKLREQRPKLVV